MEITDIIEYCETDGLLRWKINRTNGVKAGDVAGSRNHDGYLRVKVLGKHYAAHRLAWFLHYGEFPSMEIDHINRNRADNRIVNLRVVTTSENAMNAGMRKSNTTGFIGVVLHKQTGKYQAQIKANGVPHYLGLFGNLSSAHAAYKSAKETLHQIGKGTE
jgi:hypothetical protein